MRPWSPVLNLLVVHVLVLRLRSNARLLSFYCQKISHGTQNISFDRLFARFSQFNLLKKFNGSFGSSYWLVRLKIDWLTSGVSSWGKNVDHVLTNFALLSILLLPNLRVTNFMSITYDWFYKFRSLSCQDFVKKISRLLLLLVLPRVRHILPAICIC